MKIHLCQRELDRLRAARHFGLQRDTLVRRDAEHQSEGPQNLIRRILTRREGLLCSLTIRAPLRGHGPWAFPSLSGAMSSRAFIDDAQLAELLHNESEQLSRW